MGVVKGGSSQAAFLVKHPESYGTSFWDSLPHGTFYPMWILATLAAIIASQALISAAFQIVKQAITQGFFPRFTVIHTSKKVGDLPQQQGWGLSLLPTGLGASPATVRKGQG